MATVYHSYYEIEEPGIYRRVGPGYKKSAIYINEGSRPRTPGEFINDYDVDGDDAYMQNEEDKENAPNVFYEKIDELENVSKYLSGPLATMLKDPFKDDQGVLYANKGKTLVKAPRTLEGEYQCREGLEVIFRYAFEDCNELTKVVLPGTLKEIGCWAFRDCHKLASVELPSSLKKLNTGVFDSCGLVQIKIPQSVTVIPSNLFDGCKMLERVELHDRIVQLAGDAFESTGRLFELVLPKHINSLGYMPFRYSSLTNIVIPGSVKVVDRAAFYSSKNLCFVVLDEGVVELEDAFSDCENLEYVVLPASLKKVDEDVFENSMPLLFVPQGMMDHFRKILPQRLHERIREGSVPKEMKEEVAQKIAMLIEESKSETESFLLPDLLGSLDDDDDEEGFPLFL